MNNILIIRLSSIGDIVLTEPVTAVLRRKYPSSKIHFLTKKAFVPLAETFDCVDRILIWEDYNTLFKIWKLTKQKYDLIVDLHNKFNTLLIKLMIRGEKTVTYNKQRFLRQMIVKHKTDKSIESTIDLYFSALRKIGIEEKAEYPKMHITGSLPKEYKELIDPKKQNLAIFPGAAHRTKQYPTDHIVKFINLLNEDFKVFLLGSEKERELTQNIMQSANMEVVDLCGKLSLYELISFIGQVDIIFSNDSGPMHIAAALQKPQIAVFGSTHPKLGFSPRNKHAIVLSADLYCQPCSLHGRKKCRRKIMYCFQEITPEAILEKINILRQ